MLHIHPFPARMAPEIVLTKLASLKPGQIVLDPMVGSGLVLSTAAKAGIRSIGVDIDPLSILIASVASTKVNSDDVYDGIELLFKNIKSKRNISQRLSWIDSDIETSNFINYWYYKKQISQLRKLSFYLVEKPIRIKPEVRKLIIAAISRLIITKEPKASLARDTAHSRPHKVLLNNNYDIISSLQNSVQHIMRALNPDRITVNSCTYSADARNLYFIDDNYVDSIITSPPYLNAIDYMRGHKFSLVWFGFKISELRNIRSRSIGAERILGSQLNPYFANMLREFNLSKNPSNTNLMIQRYYFDLYSQLQECYRVLKPNHTAIFVIGNSMIKGQYIPNSMFLKRAANVSGFKIISEETREIPNNRRYLPILLNSSNQLSNRMRTEHIITFTKTKYKITKKIFTSKA